VPSVIHDIKKTQSRQRDRFRECNRLVGDAYRALGKAHHRVSFVVSLKVKSEGGKGQIEPISVDAPLDMPEAAKRCFMQSFVREFSTTHQFDGELAYGMCVSVLAKPLDEFEAVGEAVSARTGR
jgi:hypothetical protein